TDWRPCLPQFKAAFGCFVFSPEEEKGVDCVAQFRSMQECFSRHSEYYSSGSKDDAPKE
ncbi:hypothetical protein H696_04481, partial [Fonticula alba]